jgi:hypothetical protein
VLAARLRWPYSSSTDGAGRGFQRGTWNIFVPPEEPQAHRNPEIQPGQIGDYNLDKADALSSMAVIGQAMTNTKAQIVKIATEIARHQESRTAQLKHELKAIEAKKAKLQTELHAMNLAQERLGRFVPVRGGKLHCPRCWMNHETISDLRSVGGGDKNTDNFRCNICDETFALTF